MLMMQKMHQMIVRRPSGPVAYYANAVEFDGTNDYLSKASAISAATSSQGSIAFFTRPATAGGTTSIFRIYETGGSGGYLTYRRNTDNSVEFAIGDGIEEFSIASNAGALTEGVWQIAFLSWSTNFSSGNKIGRFYVGDTDELSSVGDFGGAFSINYTGFDDIGIGDEIFRDRYIGGMSNFYFSTTYTDWSVEANRREFVDALGKPVELDPALVSAAEIYLDGDFTNFEINSGTGGNFTENGALTAAATSPSD